MVRALVAAAMAGVAASRFCSTPVQRERGAMPSSHFAMMGSTGASRPSALVNQRMPRPRGSSPVGSVAISSRRRARPVCVKSTLMTGVCVPCSWPLTTTRSMCSDAPKAPRARARHRRIAKSRAIPARVASSGDTAANTAGRWTSASTTAMPSATLTCSDASIRTGAGTLSTKSAIARRVAHSPPFSAPSERNRVASSGSEKGSSPSMPARTFEIWSSSGGSPSARGR